MPPTHPAPAVPALPDRAPDLAHPFPFAPAHGYDPPRLLAVAPPPEPEGFDAFWRARYAAARAVDPDPVVGPAEGERDGVRLHPVTYASTGGVRTGGWLALPVGGRPARYGFVIGHGYGGRGSAAPDLPLPLPDAAALLPCVRGMGERGRRPGVPDTADAHVLHGIDDRDGYVIGGCVDDLWCAASALLRLVPELAAPGAARLGYAGESLGGGLGALALPWDERFGAARLTVPTFGHHPLRLTLPCTGSGEAVRAHHARHPEVTEVLAHYDAATAATRLRTPTLVAPALFDPAVPPPGQFAVRNALAGPRTPRVLSAGHFTHRGEQAERAALDALGRRFFARWLGA
ncbi:acetylxylan esterase [Streptomyces sp. NPDC002490]|uniref:acetylxylan esterase n=1 Tax=Streptomyces sp. NPDC002490 TaxID=3154416 RepID=UPI0033196932